MGKSARWIKKILGLKKKSSKEKTPGKNPESNQILAKPPLPLNDAPKIPVPQPAAPPKGEPPLPAPPPSSKFQDRQIQCTEEAPVEDPKHTEYDAGDEDIFPKVISQEDLAAVRIQKAFRCYLSKRALRALRSVIRLQALARGHAIRRQAAAALRCVQAIVRVQAIFRGRQVRLSEEGQAIQYLLQRYRQETDSWQLADQEPYQHVYRGNSASAKEADKALAYALQRQVEWSKAKKQPLYIDSALESGSGWGWLQRWTAARPWALSSLESPEAGAEQPPRVTELKPAVPRVEQPRQAELKPELSPRYKEGEETPPRLETPPQVITYEERSMGLSDDDDTPNVEDFSPDKSEGAAKVGDGLGIEVEKKANGHQVVEEDEVDDDEEYFENHHPHHHHQQQQEQLEEDVEQEELEQREFDDEPEVTKESGGFDDEPVKEDEEEEESFIVHTSSNNNSGINNSPHLMIPQQQQRSVPSYMAATQSAKAKVRAQSPKSISPGVQRRFSVSGKASLESSPSTGTSTTPRRLSLPGGGKGVSVEGSGSPRRSLSLSNGGVTSRSPQSRSGGKSGGKGQENGVRRSTELRKSFRF